METPPASPPSTGTVLALLCTAAAFGVTAASMGTCVASLIVGEGERCGTLGFAIGIPISLVVGTVLGLPLQLVFSRLQLRRWWQYVLGGTLLAAPIWYELAGPFASARWAYAGLYDSMLYLGSGAAGGLLFWTFLFKLKDASQE